MPGWNTDRPVYHRLPEESQQYQGNDVVDALTYPIDKILVDYKNALLNFEANFINPDTCRADALDWLAQLCGYTGEYWDSTWTEEQKRKLIKYSHIFVWAQKGSEILLNWLLNDVFELSATIYQVGEFLADISEADNDVIGGDLLEYFILLPLSYETYSKEWKLAEKINKLYSPVWVDSDVVYDGFYADFSEVGDPVL
jgi:phage tail P2-like protein